MTGTLLVILMCSQEALAPIPALDVLSNLETRLFERGVPVVISDGFAGVRGSGGKFHLGMDLKLPAQAKVHAVTAGTVRVWGRYEDVSVEVTEELAPGVVRSWVYGHVDPAWSIRSGSRVEAGEYLGRIVKWPFDSLDGDREHHLHIELWLDGVRGDADAHAVNLRRYFGMVDNLPPVIDHVWFSNPGIPTAVYGSLSGRIHVVVEAFDEMNPPFDLAVHELRVDVRRKGSGEVVHTTIRRMPDTIRGGDKFASARRCFDGLLTIPTLRDDETVQRTLRNNRVRRALYVPTLGDAWDTTKVADGEYEVTVRASDEFGNSSFQSHTVRVSN